MIVNLSFPYAHAKAVQQQHHAAANQSEQSAAKDVGRVVHAQVHAGIAEYKRPQGENPPCVACDGEEKGDQKHRQAETVGRVGGGEAVMPSAVLAAVWVCVHMHHLHYFRIVCGAGTLYLILYHHRSAVGAEYAEREKEQRHPCFFPVVPEKEKEREEDKWQPVSDVCQRIHNRIQKRGVVSVYPEENVHIDAPQCLHAIQNRGIKGIFSVSS